MNSAEFIQFIYQMRCYCAWPSFIYRERGKLENPWLVDMKNTILYFPLNVDELPYVNFLSKFIEKCIIKIHSVGCNRNIRDEKEQEKQSEKVKIAASSTEHSFGPFKP